MENQTAVDYLFEEIVIKGGYSKRANEIFQQAKELEAQRQLDLSKVKRFEVINHAKNNLEIGRILTTRGFTSLEASIQDEGSTLKIFMA